MRMTEAR
jgi:hypothetical protein